MGWLWAAVGRMGRTWGAAGRERGREGLVLTWRDRSQTEASSSTLSRVNIDFTATLKAVPMVFGVGVWCIAVVSEPR